MSDVVVRGISDNEIRDYLRCLGTAFHMGSDVTDDRVEFSRKYMNDLSRRLGAFVDGALCGTAGSFGAQLTVPGGNEVPTACVTQVTVMPTHRRRGLLREMMEFQLRDAKQRGEIAAMLIAAEWPIYGRFGYGLAVEAAATIIDAAAAEFLDPTVHGSIEIVDGPTLRDLAPAPFDIHRAGCPGSISREPVMWDLSLGILRRPGDDPPKGWVRAVHRNPDGEVDGYVDYTTPDEKWEHNRPRIKLEVHELIATNDTAYTDLWKFLCAVDWVVEVHAHVRPVDEDLRHLFINGRVARQADRSDHMWVRLLDVPAALAARTYEADVSVVIDARDDLFGGGRFRLEAAAGGAASCTPTDEAADIALDVDVLGAAYLGGAPLRPYATAARIDELTPGTVAALDRAMRTPRAPWAPTGF